MNKFLPLLLISFLLLSCTSSKKMLERGQYDRAIERSTEKLIKKPSNSKELTVLEEAYELANMFDQERIDFLELEGREESWVEIYQLYEQMNWRQNRVRRLPAQLRNRFTFYNYDQEIIESKSAAAEISYKRGLEYMEMDDKMSARQAFYEFETAAQIYPGYENVDQNMEQALLRGANYALFIIENNSGMILPEYFDSELKKVSLRDQSSRWVVFDTYENENIDYNYFVTLNITDINFSPERIEQKTFTESNEIEDGLRYELDENGNVRKDSLGNDIQVPNLVTVTAEVTENIQSKSAFVAGSLDFYELESDQLIRTDNIAVEAVFRHQFGNYTGNREALSEESMKIIRGREIPFQSNESMLMNAAELLKDRAVTIITRNRRVLEG